MNKLILNLIILSMLSGCSDSSKPKNRETTWNDKIELFSSCKEIKDYVSSFYSQDPDYVNDVIAPLPPKDPTQNYENQIENVLEGDILQMSSKYFFFVRTGSIEITERESLEKHKSIPIRAMDRQWLLYSDKKLIYVGGSFPETVIQIFDETKNFERTYTKTFNSTLIEFRLTQNRLTVLTKGWSVSALNSTECSKIYKPNLENGSSQITLINTIDFNSSSITEQTVGALGSTDFMYMTQDELFLFAYDYYLSSHFRTFDLKTTTPIQLQAERFAGVAKDRWSVTKNNDALFISSSFTNEISGAEGQTFRRENKILAYELVDKKYVSAGESPSFGHNEDIRAVRYLNNKAYIVTFEKTDPLFILDIKNPKQIQILSELKSPGFSTQLRELKAGKMVGLGYQADDMGEFSWFGGLKLSLFDLENPLLPTELDVLNFGQRGSYSEATAEPKALFISPHRDRVLFPAVILEKDAGADEWTFGQNLQFAGALVLSVEGSNIREVGRLSHQEWREKICSPKSYLPMGWWSFENVSSDIQRAIQLDNKIYTFSRFGVMRSALNLEPESETEYENSAELCEPN